MEHKVCLYKIQPQGAFSILVFTTPVKTWIFGVMKYAKVFCCGVSTRMMFYFEIFAHIDCAHLFCTPFWKSVDFTRIIIYYCFSDAVVDTTTFKIVLLSFYLPIAALFFGMVFFHRGCTWKVMWSFDEKKINVWRWWK